MTYIVWKTIGFVFTSNFSKKLCLYSLHCSIQKLKKIYFQKMALLVFSGVSTATLIKKALFVFIALPVFLATLKTIKFFSFQKSFACIQWKFKKRSMFSKKALLVFSGNPGIFPFTSLISRHSPASLSLSFSVNRHINKNLKRRVRRKTYFYISI